MAKLKKAIFGILKRLAYSLFLIGFFVIGFQLGQMYYKHNLDTGDTFSEWLDYEKECSNELEYHSLNELEYSCDDRVIDYEKIHFYVKIEVLFVFLVSLFDYFKEPEEHWISNMKRWFKSLDGEY